MNGIVEIHAALEQFLELKRLGKKTEEAIENYEEQIVDLSPIPSLESDKEVK